MRRSRNDARVLRGVALVALGFLVHCADQSSEDSLGGGGGGGGGACIGPGCGAGANSATGGSSAGGSSGAAGAPPEQEIESSFRSPVATDRYVWTANPKSSRVARVDAVSFETRTFEAGYQPTFLVAVPAGSTGKDRALVINSGSDDATLFTMEPSSEVTLQSAPLHEGANSWTVSQDGRFAIAWSNFTQYPHADVTEGFQDVTVLDMTGSKMTSTRLSVGYRPSRIVIDAAGSQAFAVTEPGITVIDLATSFGPTVSRDVPISDDPLVPARDVEITPDGAFAIVRRDGSADVGLVSLSDGQRVTLSLSGPVTDIDLTADGTRAVAVVRSPGSPEPPADGGTVDAGADGAGESDAESDASVDASNDAAIADAGPPPAAKSSEVFVLPIPGVFTDPSLAAQVSIPGQTVGSVAIAESGTAAVLYTNATPNDHVTLLNLTPGGTLSHRTVTLKAPVLAAFPAPDGAHAIVLLSPGTGSTKAGAFGVVPITANLPPKIQGTDAPPIAVSIAPAPSSRAIVTTRSDSQKIYATYLTRLPELQVDRIGLASPPLASGMVPAASAAFVAQEHPEGRITFIDWIKGDARTLTGFELGAKVVQ